MLNERDGPDDVQQQVQTTLSADGTAGVVEIASHAIAVRGSATH